MATSTQDGQVEPHAYAGFLDAVRLTLLRLLQAWLTCFPLKTAKQTGFDFDFPAFNKDPVAAAAVGFKGKHFLAESMDITRWYNRATNVIVGSVFFSSSCEGPPGEMLYAVRDDMVACDERL